MATLFNVLYTHVSNAYLWHSSVGKGSYSATMCSRHLQGMKPASSKITICSSSYVRKGSLTKTVLSRDAKRGLKQVGDVHRNARLHSYFILTCNSTTYHIQAYSFIGMPKKELKQVGDVHHKCTSTSLHFDM